MNNDDKMFAMLEKIFIELQATKIELQATNTKLQATNIELTDFKKEVIPRLDRLDNKIDKEVIPRLDRLDNVIDKEVIPKLDRLDSNQESIKRFILNSDKTFKKSEEAYDFIQKFREFFAE